MEWPGALDDDLGDELRASREQRSEHKNQHDYAAERQLRS
jgi:hypothetical protein